MQYNSSKDCNGWLAMSNFLASTVLFRQDYTIMDTVLSAPRGSFPDIVKLTEKNVQSGNVHDLKVVPGYYTVATDRGARIKSKFVRFEICVILWS